MTILDNHRVCLNCGSKFIRKNKNQQFCSRKCNVEFSKRRKERTVTCSVCGKVFKTNFPHKIYCSATCKFSKPTKPRKKPAKTIVTAKCVICGKTLERSYQKVCSAPECIRARRKQIQPYKPRPYQPKKKPPGSPLTPEMRARLKEIKAINPFRESMGLRPIAAGIIQCCLCQEDFFSEDITRLKTCGPCKEHTSEIEPDSIGQGGAKRNKKWLL